ncbi:putative inactive receptor kinase [Apostasia shenzhenica]|uniref:Putative inactive receptor kinase n=1 Tax=Apostasia shenzhenica TaxID=1088818 RepID=A0A2I0B0I8_9ASPA|nr:putative inactive receptor kinase [Apostasia shenzhenica]
MSRRHRRMDSLFALLFFVASLSTAAADLAGDGIALMAFRSAVGKSALSWNASVSPCQWPGVGCERNRVVSLRLPGTGLIGQIPVGTLGNLSDVHTLSLRLNALSGSLPTDLARCTQLRNLYLQGNRFSGEVPAFLPSLSCLVRLDLADNNFSGSIPPALNNLTRIGTLYLQNNQITGEIPELDLPNLVQFNVSFNRLNGSIPVKLRGMPADSFVGMPLCGGPLGPCPGEAAPPAGNGGSSPSGGGSKLSGGAIAGIAISAVALFLIIVTIVFLFCRQKTDAMATKSMDTGAAKPPEVEVALTDKRVVDGVGAKGAAVAAAPTVSPAGTGSKKQLVFLRNAPRVYDLEDLLRASAEVLGKGTFGTAYKAVLETGLVVAVKRLRDVNMPEKEFKEKIDDIGMMDHPNLVPLQSYYHSNDEKLLVYDYMPLGSLSSLLHGNRGSGRTPLSWETRTSIAMAAARGIEYIHSTSRTASHGNIKSSNILLADTFDARVSDHGLAHLVGASATSNRIAGYRAPEVTDTRRISQKADVYSFGVVLLELLTGKAPAQALLNEDGVDLPRWVQSVVREEWTSEVFDLELLRYQSVEDEMVQMLQLGVNCTAQYPDRRPAMSVVVSTIEEIQRSSIAARRKDQQQVFDDDR